MLLHVSLRNVNQKPEVKYPVTVKFDRVNFSQLGQQPAVTILAWSSSESTCTQPVLAALRNVNTNGFALWEAGRGGMGVVERKCACTACLKMPEVCSRTAAHFGDSIQRNA